MVSEEEAISSVALVLWRVCDDVERYQRHLREEKRKRQKHRERGRGYIHVSSIYFDSVLRERGGMEYVCTCLVVQVEPVYVILVQNEFDQLTVNVHIHRLQLTRLEERERGLQLSMCTYVMSACIGLILTANLVRSLLSKVMWPSRVYSAWLAGESCVLD